MEKKLLSKDGVNIVLQKFRPIDGYVQMELITDKTSTKRIKNWVEHRFPLNELKKAVKLHFNATHLGSYISRINWDKVNLRSSTSCWTGETSWWIRFDLLEREDEVMAED